MPGRAVTWTVAQARMHVELHMPCGHGQRQSRTHPPLDVCGTRCAPRQGAARLQVAARNYQQVITFGKGDNAMCCGGAPPHDNGRQCAVSPPIHTHTHTNCEIEHSLKYLSTMFTYMHHEWLSSMTGHASHGQLALFLRAMCCEGHHGELPPLCWVATYTHPHTYKL